MGSGPADRIDAEPMHSTTHASEPDCRRTNVLTTKQRQHMLVTTEKIADTPARPPGIATLRMRLKPAHRSCGFVQGAWWPRSTELTAELPSLLAALSLRFGPIDGVLYHESDWSPAPLSIKHQGGEVVLEASQESPNVISVFGQQVGRLILLVVPPYTEHTHAYTVMTTAASANDVSTPHQLLGMSMHRDDDHHLAPITFQRWESDGGALAAAPPIQLQLQDA